MQNRYTGDIGDYGKYAFLNALAREDLRLAVVWYLNPSEERNEDGRLTTYLDAEHRPIYRKYDPRLYDALSEIVSGERQVSAIRERGILPQGTIFYEEKLDYVRESDWQAREQRRRRWCGSALRETQKADIVFFDPDNGMAPDSAKRTSKRGAKYVFQGEIEPYLSRQQSVVLYQHLDRSAALAEQVARGRRRLSRLAAGRSPWALSFHAWQVRIYLVSPAPSHSPVLEDRSRTFLESGWKEHFRKHPAESIRSQLESGRSSLA